jgi:hypothetical protein
MPNRDKFLEYDEGTADSNMQRLHSGGFFILGLTPTDSCHITDLRRVFGTHPGLAAIEELSRQGRAERRARKLLARSKGGDDLAPDINWYPQCLADMPDWARSQTHEEGTAFVRWLEQFDDDPDFPTEREILLYWARVRGIKQPIST